MEVLLSIIIPVYNVSEYIVPCLENILGKYEDIVEIILVDDGSTDQSGTIIDQYEKNHKNVRAYHKVNGGLSDARNYGFLRAKGNYVFFYDSDDFVTESFLETVVNLLNTDTVDALLWDADIYDESGQLLKIDSSYYHHRGLEEQLIYTGSELIEEQLDDHNDYVTTVWSGLYSRELLIHNNLWFEKDLLHEDEMWTQKVLLACNRVRYIKSPFYCYRRRQNSIMNPTGKNYSKNIEALIYIFSYLPLYYDLKVKDKEFKKKLKGNTTKRFLHMIGKYQLVKYPGLMTRVDRRKLLCDANTIKDKLRALILFINMRLYCRLARQK